MTSDLTTLFEGKEIRAIDQDGEPRFLLVDFAHTWEMNPNTLYQIMRRNKKKFAGFTSDVHVTWTDTLQGVKERGMYLLMGSINTDRLKNAQVADAILRFQRWVPGLIQRYRKQLGQTALSAGPQNIRSWQ